jgi:hypothetical protein
MGALAREPDDTGSLNEGPSDGPSNDGPSKDGPPSDGPSKYAPKSERRPAHQQQQNLGSAPAGFDPEPPWRRKGQPGAFTDDVAELDSQPGLMPDGVPQPPASDKPVKIFGAKGRLVGAIVLTAAGAAGYVWGSGPRATAPGLPASVGVAERVMPVPAASPESARAQTPLPRLTVDAVRWWQVGETVPVTISSTDAGSNVNVVIRGLAPGSALSAGTPAGLNAWRLAIKDFNSAAIRPPRGFVGVMNLTLELRLADEVVDRKTLQVEWSGTSVPASAAHSQRLDATEVALLMKKGAEFVADGNIGAARMTFQLAADAGEPRAAFALAETYDPLVLEKLGTKGGITPDIALAQRWYEKAKALGSTMATERLQRLAHVPEKTGDR